MADYKLYSPDIAKQVNEILPLYGDSNFADILNRLWMNGAKVEDLQKALLQQGGSIGNTPQDVMSALIEQKIVTPDQLKQAASSYVPPNATNQPWPFHPEHTDAKGNVVPVFNDDSTKFYPSAPHPIAQQQPTQLAPAGKPTGITTVGSGAGAAKKDMTKASPAEVEKYEREHYANMLWVKQDPELAGLLENAARHEWTPEYFRSQFENSKWWLGKKDTVRKFIERQNTDGETLNSEIDTKTKNYVAMSEAMGFGLTYQDLVPLATDAIKFGWDDLTAKQNIIGKIQFDPNQAGGLGAFQTKAKAMGKDYLMTMSDQEAFDWSKKLFTGEATEDTIKEALAQKAKGAYPTIADYIENGGTPKSYFGQHIATAAQLLEVDPSDIDLTSSDYNQIISYSDDKGNVRPMSVPETSRFIKQKDAYWKTSNSANEVSGILNTLGTAFGKVAM